MPKIFLVSCRPGFERGASCRTFSRWYDVATPQSADVRTVLQQQPDLIMLQTDVRTLDCCGLLTQLKGNEATAPVKIILLR